MPCHWYMECDSFDSKIEEKEQTKQCELRNSVQSNWKQATHSTMVNSDELKTWYPLTSSISQKLPQCLYALRTESPWVSHSYTRKRSIHNDNDETERSPYNRNEKYMQNRSIVHDTHRRHCAATQLRITCC